MATGFSIRLRFTVFDVEYYPDCSYDYLRVIERGQVLGSYCGSKGQGHSEAVSEVKSTGNKIQVIFHTDYSNEEMFRGFEGHYIAVGMLKSQFYSSVINS